MFVRLQGSHLNCFFIYIYCVENDLVVSYGFYGWSSCSPSALDKFVFSSFPFQVVLAVETDIHVVLLLSITDVDAKLATTAAGHQCISRDDHNRRSHIVFEVTLLCVRVDTVKKTCWGLNSEYQNGEVTCDSKCNCVEYLKNCIPTSNFQHFSRIGPREYSRFSECLQSVDNWGLFVLEPRFRR